MDTMKTRYFLSTVDAANPANSMRITAKKNDLRNWTPTHPVLVCTGNGDLTMFYNANT